jgi:hypothetical protein
MAGQLTIDTLRAGSGVLATQNGMTGIAKAWVTFDGTVGSPTPAGSFNIASITKNGTGNYTLNFTTAMANANYSAVGMTIGQAGPTVARQVCIVAQATGTLQIATGSTSSASLTDLSIISVAVLGA